jgi:hypothetical protein
MSNARKKIENNRKNARGQNEMADACKKIKNNKRKRKRPK